MKTGSSHPGRQQRCCPSIQEWCHKSQCPSGVEFVKRHKGKTSLLKVHQQQKADEVKLGSLLQWSGDTEHGKSHYTTLFSPQFTGKIFLQESQAPETYVKAWSSEGLSLVEEDRVSKYFKTWGVHMCMVSDRDALQTAEGTGPCHCELHLWKIMAIWDIQSYEYYLFWL